MRGLWVAARARRFVLCIAAVVLLSAVPAVWPLAVIQVTPTFDSPGRGAALGEILAVLLAALVPPSQLTSLSYIERSVVGRRRVALLTFSLVSMALPLIPFAVWWWRVRSADLGDVPAPTPFLLALLVVAALGVVATQVLGQVIGPAALLGAYLALYFAQARWGPGVLWGAFPTGEVWQVQPLAVVVALMAVTLVLVRTRGATLSPLPDHREADVL